MKPIAGNRSFVTFGPYNADSSWHSYLLLGSKLNLNQAQLQKIFEPIKMQIDVYPKQEGTADCLFKQVRSFFSFSLLSF